jgi:hypothetical protein
VKVIKVPGSNVMVFIDDIAVPNKKQNKKFLVLRLKGIWRHERPPARPRSPADNFSDSQEHELRIEEREGTGTHRDHIQYII